MTPAIRQFARPWRREFTRRKKTLYIGIHTAASGESDEGPLSVYYPDAERIHGWHLDRPDGFTGIGYAWVCLADGRMDEGRPDWAGGAHIAGINSESFGVCVAGHGDILAWTPEQWVSMVSNVSAWADRWKVRTDRIIGHREVNDLIRMGSVSAKYKTDKSCPGDLISMTDFRAAVAQCRAAKRRQPPVMLPYPWGDEPIPAVVSDPEADELLLRGFENLYASVGRRSLEPGFTARLNELRRRRDADEAIQRAREARKED